MATTERISNIIPDLYYQEPNGLIKFTQALDVEFAEFERQISALTDLINVDKCPDDKLVYLAALTGCPLIGTDPVFWRRQIKSWPDVLKLKGTKRSLELVLKTIGAESWNISTYFRDANGNYTTLKPDGEPFQDAKGVWRNSRTHYFGIELFLSKDFVESENYSWDFDELKEKLYFWIGNGKPFHAELLNFSIYPPSILPDDHICRWDFCTWEHFILKNYEWGLLTPDEPLFDDNAVIKRDFERELFTIHDTAFWDINTWGGVPVRLLQIGPCSENAITAYLEWGEGEKSLLYPTIWDYTKWDYSATFERSIVSENARIFDINFDLDLVPPIYRAVTEYLFNSTVRARWNSQTWQDFNNIWDDNFSPDMQVGFSTYNSLSASMSSGLYTKWRQNGNTTWANINSSWINTTQNNFSWNIKSEEED